MGNLEKVNQAQLKNVLTGTEGQLQKRLPEEESKALGMLLERTARRYPNQDLSQTLDEYMVDLEKLALKYSLQSVEDAIAMLRIDPEQEFFPTPDEVAHQINQTRLRKLPSHLYARG